MRQNDLWRPDVTFDYLTVSGSVSGQLILFLKFELHKSNYRRIFLLCPCARHEGLCSEVIKSKDSALQERGALVLTKTPRLDVIQCLKIYLLR